MKKLDYLIAEMKAVYISICKNHCQSAQSACLKTRYNDNMYLFWVVHFSFASFASFVWTSLSILSIYHLLCLFGQVCPFCPFFICFVRLDKFVHFVHLSFAL